MTSAEIVAEFVRGRPVTLAQMQRKMSDRYCAPEMYQVFAQSFVLEAMKEVTDAERKKLDRMRGNGAVDWDELAHIFGAPLYKKLVADAKKGSR